MVQGVRGATVAAEDSVEAILSATRQLLEAMVEANPGLYPEHICSIFFTVTDDLQAIYPALAARQMGWTQAPMLCAREIPVPGALPHCVRILLHWNTSQPQSAIRHVYLGAAAGLRPDLSLAALV